jgi:hypothetical protein
MAVVLAGGNHRVVLDHHARGFAEGLFVALLGLVLLAGARWRPRV